jgi:hypothetical protein
MLAEFEHALPMSINSADKDVVCGAILEKLT